MSCRECLGSNCNCLLTPEDKLQLASPSWESVEFTISSTLLPETLAKIKTRLSARAHEAMNAFYSTGDTESLTQLMLERRECVVGLKALLPVTHVTVLADAEEALTYASSTGTGEWCVALPLEPTPYQRVEAFRGYIVNKGVFKISVQESYDVISHNWPRTNSRKTSHASVLGIWWEIPQAAFRQIESVFAIAETFGQPVWVDFLCIDQENAEEKNEALPDMGRIYANSRYGFVDCTMTPTLSTVAPSSIEQLIEIEPTKPITISDEERRDRLRNVITAQWFSRCWTFQEGLLTPELKFYDPSHAKVICDFHVLQNKCIQEFHYLHATNGHEIAKSEGWFHKAASIMNQFELMEEKVLWNLGNVLAIRGMRDATEECDQINSLLGILNVKCGYKGLTATKTLDATALATFLSQCAENKDTSWVVGEDPTWEVPHFSWAPSSPYARYSTQADSASIKWLSLTKDGPQLSFHRACPVSAVIAIQKNDTIESIVSALQDYQVDGEWFFEYCGVAFGMYMEDPLPISVDDSNEIFKTNRGSWDELEKALLAKLPKGAEWRAKELRKYLLGFEGRFNAWIICETPVRRLALLAKIIDRSQPKEALLGFPIPCKYRTTHRFFPVMLVNDSEIRKRVGWVWPCIHSTLKSEEEDSEECIRCISH